MYMKKNKNLIFLRSNRLNKVFYCLLFFLFFNCEEEKTYHQNLELVWESKNVNWNALSLKVDDTFIYGHTNQDSVFKLDIKDGRVLWKRYSRGSYASLTPVIQDDLVIFGGSNGLKAFTKDGTLHWSENTGTKTVGLLLKDSIVFNVRTSEGLFANKVQTGEEVWHIKPDYQMLTPSNPILMDSLILLGDFDYRMDIGDHLACININQQKVVWQTPKSMYMHGESTVHKNTLIIHTDSVYKKGVTSKINPINGDIIWETQTNPVLFHQSKVLKNKIFVPSYRHGIVCLDEKNGNILWKLDKETYPNTDVLIHNDILYFGTIKNQLIGMNEYGDIVLQSDFYYGIGHPFVYQNTVHIPDGRGNLFRLKTPTTSVIH